MGLHVCLVIFRVIGLEQVRTLGALPCGIAGFIERLVVFAVWGTFGCLLNHGVAHIDTLRGIVAKVAELLLEGTLEGVRVFHGNLECILVRVVVSQFCLRRIFQNA